MRPIADESAPTITPGPDSHRRRLLPHLTSITLFFLLSILSRHRRLHLILHALLVNPRVERCRQR
ncbi:hypothetical protein D3C81_2289550 [compost metagenome]